MARVVTDPKDFEVWRSTIRGKIYIKRFDRKGELINEVILPGKVAHISPDERRINQEMAAEPTLDPFMNGFLVPVRLVDGREDNEELQSNPNSIADDKIRALLNDRRSLKNLKDTLATIENPMTVQRFLSIAHEDDVDATVKQIAAIQARLAEISTEGIYNEVEQFQSPTGRDAYRTKAPQSEAPRNPSVGRR